MTQVVTHLFVLRAINQCGVGNSLPLTSASIHTMQFQLRLVAGPSGQFAEPTATANRSSQPQCIPFNYAYALTGALYRLLANADDEYARFLHERGYQTDGITGSRKTFRLFTFSDLRMHGYEVRPREGCFVLTSPVVDWTLSFYVDRAAEAFVAGLFQNQRITVANRQHRTELTVERVEMIPVALTDNADTSGRVTLRTLSPVVVAEKDASNMDQYLHPADELFGPLLLQNVIDKYRSVYTDAPPPDIADFSYRLLTPPDKARSRLVTIKEGTREETKVRGWYGFDFALTGPFAVLEVGVLAGVGRYNAEGFGCVRVV